MPRRWWALVAVSLATFMTYLDNNVTNVAIPTIQRDLHLSVAGLEWVVSSYILVFAGLLLAGGRLADVFGRRRMFLTGLSVFTLASLGAGLAGSGAELIGFRLAQGLGAALLVPTTLAILVATFDNLRERATAIGAWTAIGAAALAGGRSSAASSASTSTGAGSSSSTCRSASSPASWPWPRWRSRGTPAPRGGSTCPAW